MALLTTTGEANLSGMAMNGCGSKAGRSTPVTATTTIHSSVVMLMGADITHLSLVITIRESSKEMLWQSGGGADRHSRPF
jgi:hypothetical protein